MSATMKLVAAAGAVGLVAVLWLSFGGTQRRADDTAPQRDQPAAAARLAPRRDLRGPADEPIEGPLRGLDSGRAARRNSTLGERRVARAARRRAADETRSQPGVPAANQGAAEVPASKETFESVKQTALSDPDPEQRAHAIEMLSFYEDDEATVVAVLSVALSDPDAEVRMAALDELGVVAEEPPLPLLETALRDSDAEIRASAVRMIADSEDEARMPLLQGALHDPDEDVRAEAQDALDLDVDNPESAAQNPDEEPPGQAEDMRPGGMQ